ncbi:hypothetical protein MATL_G00117320 [Megalops atlanticus]|uniref:Calpain-9-like n=1 Tax=Megalops atlanticus TaxID=7932 RepID=A0A9D3TCN0_MEGAT|nr:hypothetical protein MATL_G00117320 [Megalops atlanticus]
MSHTSKTAQVKVPDGKNSLDDELFVDHSFPSIVQPSLEWKRPKEICPSAKFIVDGATRMDVCQGVLCDCWFLSAVASLSLHQALLERVVPVEQDFQSGYTGAFTFRFWQYGVWKEVTIDDLLPTHRGELVFLRSSNSEEFWTPLLEKAYAKLKGGYQALNMGFPHEAMVDMTGGVAEVFTLSSLPKDLAGFMMPLLRKGALINCGNTQGPLEKTNELGIMFKHAYSVTGVETVQTSCGPVDLVRVHNPWGRAEWEGPWSDTKGKEWCQVSEEEQSRLQRVQKEDGEFWMSVSDFRQNFEMIEVCHLSEDTLSEPGAVRRPWKCTLSQGSWLHNVTAGGSPKGVRYWQNPQYQLTLLEEDDDPSDPELTCSFLVALMQKSQRRTGIHLHINLHIYKARPDREYLSSTDLLRHRPLRSLPDYTQHAEVVLRGRLPPGRYIVIPSTKQENQEGEFILRIFTEKGNQAVPADKPQTDEDASVQQPTSPALSVLPSEAEVYQLFKKHRSSRGNFGAAELLNLLTEAIRGGALAGSESGFSLEHCKSFVALMDSNGLEGLDWEEFQILWERFRRWTDIFVKFDKNQSRSLDSLEIAPALTAAGLQVDEFVLQMVRLRYTEPDRTVSYAGFLYLLLKLDGMIRKFHAFDMVGMGSVTVNYRQWLYATMYN